MTFYSRNLPHWHPEGRAIFLTWRLYGSLPKGCSGGTAIPVCARTERTGKSAGATAKDWGRRFRIVDAELDRASHGPLWLRDPLIAGYVEETIIRGAELQHYELHAFVIMPNHVHILLEPHRPLAKITNAIKGVAARDANATLGRIGKHFWQDESFDHWIRNSTEFERVRRYIEWNPVRAKLTAKPADWKWSSARPEWRRLVENAQPGVAVPHRRIE
jgi:REP element-mobilizing transposase RayT